MFRKTVLLAVAGLASLLLAASAPIGTIPFPLSNVSNTPGHLDEVRSAVTFNTGFMRTYFAVWQQNSADGLNTSVYGRLVNSNGLLNGYPVMFSPAAGVNIDPDVVYNPDNDQYLIVYARNNAGIYGLIIGNAGSTVLAEFPIASGPLVTDWYYRPAAAYSTVSHQYLVTWTHNHNGFQGIEARTITNVGGTLGSIWDVTGLLTSDPDYADVAWSSPNNEFLIVWNKTATPATDMDVYGRRIQMDTSAGPAGSVFTILGSSDGESYPAVASIARTSGTGQYLVVCQTHTSLGAYFVDGQLVGQAGVLEGGRLFVSNSTGHVPAVAGNSASQEYLAAWPYDTGSLHARTISTSGIRGSEKSLPLNDEADTAVAAGAAGDFLITGSGWVQAGYPYDVFGFLWGNRLWLPYVSR